MGEESVYFAKLGARVTGIDISDVGIASLKRRAAFHHLDITALEMRCDPTDFPDASFDRIHGLGILHHVHRGRPARGRSAAAARGARGVPRAAR
jgi:cyclopropane fatty-acyl-phospholipid synthase-like methyltransferase